MGYRRLETLFGYLSFQSCAPLGMSSWFTERSPKLKDSRCIGQKDESLPKEAYLAFYIH